MSAGPRGLRRIAASLALAAIGCAASPAGAAPIGYTLSATVTVATGVFAAAGPALQASFVFDDATADGNASPQQGVYAATGAIDYVAGPIAGAVDFDRIEVIDAASDQFRVAGAFVPVGASTVATLLLIDTDGTVFASDALPATLPAAALFETAILRIETFLNGVPIDTLIAQIDAITRAPEVPAPATLPLLAAALSALALQRLRTQRRASGARARCRS